MAAESEMLVSMVGGNPMAPLLAAAVRRPKILVLLASNQTAEAAHRVRNALTTLLDGTDIRIIAIADPYSAQEVLKTLLDLEPGWDLDYTGGTKVMSAQARLAFSANGSGSSGGASYVDTGSSSVRFDDGTSVGFDQTTIPIDVIAAVHGTPIRLRPQAADRPTVKEVRGILDIGPQVHTSKELANREIKRVRSRLSEKARKDPTRWRAICGQDGGDWFELLIADAAREWLVGVEHSEVLTNVEMELGENHHAELDVVIRRGVRVGVISCSMASQLKGAGLAVAKKKLLEVAERRRQLAGSHTKFAVATFLPDHSAEVLQSDLARGNETAPTPAVWGVSQLRSLSAGDLTFFEEWF